MPDRDPELVARSLRGDGRAFRDLIGRHHAVAYAVVRGILGDRDDVDDVMQMVYLKAYQGLPGFRGEAKFSTWLYQIARREALDARGRRSMETVPIDTIEIASSDRHSPEATAGDRDLREALESAMGELDDSYRIAIELRYMAEQSYEEIAEAIGVPVGTAKTYVHRGKIELKRILSRPSWRSRATERQ